MIDPSQVPFFTAVTFRGEAGALQALKDACFEREGDDLHFAPQKVIPPPKLLDDLKARHDPAIDDGAREVLVLQQIAEGKFPPPDYPDGGRAAIMMRFLSFGQGKDISPARWLTLRDIAGLGEEADETAIAKAVIAQQPKLLSIALARKEAIDTTGYANLSLWMIDNWGTAGLNMAALEERTDSAFVDKLFPTTKRENPDLYVHMIGSGAPPDLLLEKLAKQHPEVEVMIVVASDALDIGTAYLHGTKADAERIDPEDHPGHFDAAMAHLGFVRGSPDDIDEEMAAAAAK